MGEGQPVLVGRGEVWWADLPEPWGHRPVVLLVRNEAYAVLNWLVVAPTTSRIRHAPSIVLLDPDLDRVPAQSAVMVDHMQSIRRDSLLDRITRLRPEKMREIDRAIHFVLGLRNCP